MNQATKFIEGPVGPIAEIGNYAATYGSTMGDAVTAHKGLGTGVHEAVANIVPSGDRKVDYASARNLVAANAADVCGVVDVVRNSDGEWDISEDYEVRIRMFTIDAYVPILSRWMQLPNAGGTIEPYHYKGTNRNGTISMCADF